MSTVKSIYDYEVENWLGSFKGVETETVKRSEKGQERKEYALQALKLYQEKVNNKNFDKIIEEIGKKGAAVREGIERLIYEGTLSDETLEKVLEENSVNSKAIFNACLQCLECTSCASCGLCIFTGVAAVATTSSVGSAASHAY